MGSTCCCDRELDRQVTSQEAGCLRDDAQIAEVLRMAEETVGGLSDWQRSFCTPEVLRRYLNGRKGDPCAAAEILAKSLIWREQYKDVLTGSRLPKWQGDFRLLSQSEDGHPLLYLCCQHQTRAFNVSDTLEHVAAVLETAVKTMPKSVQQMDVVVDCHGFCLRYNMDPRVVIGIAELLRQPYRDRLRVVMMVDAPMMIQPVWSIVYPLLPPATQKKFRFLNADEAALALKELGKDCASTVWQVMQSNRGLRGLKPSKPRMPSELCQSGQISKCQELDDIDAGIQNSSEKCGIAQNSCRPEPGALRSWSFCRRRMRPRRPD